MNDVAIPWPDKVLNPNNRSHRMVKYKAEKAAREQAYWLTKAAWIAAPAEGEVMVHISFHPPDARKRDTQNMFSMTKAMVDGFADAIERDDADFAFQIRRCRPVRDGKVVLWIDQFAGLAESDKVG